MTDFCVLMLLFFLITCLFSNFGFILLVLFDRSVSILSDFSIVKLTLDVFITDVFKSLLFVDSVLCEGFCFTGVLFSSAVFRNRLVSVLPNCFLRVGLLMSL